MSLRKKNRNWWKKAIKRLGIVVVVTYILGNWLKQEVTIRSMRKEQATKREVLREIEMEIEGLEDVANNYMEVEYIERIAREELGMLKPNEIVYVDIGTRHKAENKGD